MASARKIFIVWEVLLIIILMFSAAVTARELAEASDPSTNGTKVLSAACRTCPDDPWEHGFGLPPLNE